MTQSILFILVFGLATSVSAEELNKVDAEALEKTVELLNSRSQRQETIDKSADAQKTDEMVKKLVGDGADLDKIYKMSAEIFRDLAHQNKGDSAALIEQMQKAQQNPETFYNSLSPEQKKMIQEMSASIEKKNPQAQPKQP